MKKIFVTVTLFAALATTANAARLNQDNLTAVNAEVTNNVNAEAGQMHPASEKHDAYRTYALQSEENDKHILRFYDINRIVIKNDRHAVIRIYDDKWRLLEQTSDNVDKRVNEGNYYVTSTSRIRGSYQH